MKIIHPRFLIIGKQENMKPEFPACLKKRTYAVLSDVYANPNIMSNTFFLFPEVSVESFPFKLCICKKGRHKITEAYLDSNHVS